MRNYRGLGLCYLPKPMADQKAALPIYRDNWNWWRVISNLSARSIFGTRRAYRNVLLPMKLQDKGQIKLHLYLVGFPVPQ